MTGQHDRQDERLTGQLCNQSGHCPLTGCYFVPWSNTRGGIAFQQFRVSAMQAKLFKVQKMHKREIEIQGLGEGAINSRVGSRFLAQ